MTAEVAHQLQLVGGFHALGGDRHVEAARQRHDRLNDQHGFFLDTGFADEGPVDLQLVEDRLVQIAERGIAGPEIIQRDADALHLQLDRKSVVQGKSVSVRVDLVGCRIIKIKKMKLVEHHINTLSYTSLSKH